jgi:hypothetical protein
VTEVKKYVKKKRKKVWKDVELATDRIKTGDLVKEEQKYVGEKVLLISLLAESEKKENLHTLLIGTTSCFLLSLPLPLVTETLVSVGERRRLKQVWKQWVGLHKSFYFAECDGIVTFREDR